MTFPPPNPADHERPAAARPTVDPARLAANWRAVEVELDTPRPPLVERALRRLGVPAAATRVVLATPALRRSWFAAIAIVVVLGLIAADDTTQRASAFTLLFLAPIVPLVGVALAFGPGADPSHETQLATPVQGIRLVLYRSMTVLTISVVVIVALAMLSDVTRPVAAAWLLPALGLTTAAIAAMTFTTPRRAVGAVAIAWVVVAVVGRRADDRLGAFGAGAQLAFAVLTIVAITVAFRRRSRFDLLVLAA